MRRCVGCGRFGCFYTCITQFSKYLKKEKKQINLEVVSNGCSTSIRVTSLPLFSFRVECAFSGRLLHCYRDRGRATEKAIKFYENPNVNRLHLNLTASSSPSSLSLSRAFVNSILFKWLFCMNRWMNSHRTAAASIQLLSCIIEHSCQWLVMRCEIYSHYVSVSVI